VNSQSTTQLTFDADTDVGRSRRGRPNEDSIGTFVDYCNDEALLAAKGKLFVVADGMGGAAGGKEASSIAIAAVFRSYYEDPDTRIEASLERAFQAANTEVQQHGRAHPELRGLGTTIAAAVVRGRTLVVGNVGDSRAYVLRGGELRQLSLDHTMVQEQVREGVLLPEEAALHPRRHVLSRNLGYRPHAHPDFDTWTILNGDAILLCSDGLWGPVGDEDLAGLLRKKRGKQAVKALIDLANQHGGPDNISAIVIHIDSVAAGPGSVTTEPTAADSDGATTERPSALPGRPEPGAAKPGAVVTEDPTAAAGRPEPIGAHAGLATTERPTDSPGGPERAATGFGAMVTERPTASPGRPQPVLTSEDGAVPATRRPAGNTAAAGSTEPAAAPSVQSVARPSRARRWLPPALLAAVLLVGGGLLYRTISSTGSGLATRSDVAADSPARTGASPLAAPASPHAQDGASAAAAVSQAVPSLAAPSQLSSPAPSAQPAAAADLGNFVVGTFPNSLALSPDGATLALGSSNGKIQLVNAENGAPIASVKAHDMAVNSLAFSPDGQTLASAADDGTVRLWQVGNASATPPPAPSTPPAFETLRAPVQAPTEQMYGLGLDGQQIVYAVKQGEQIQLWRQGGEQPFATLDGLATDVRSVVFAADGQSLAVISGEGLLQLRGSAGGTETGTVADEPTGMWSVAFVPGRQSVVIGFPDSHVERRSFTFDAEPASSVTQASARADAAEPSPSPRAAPAEAAAEGPSALPNRPEMAPVLDLGKHASAVITVVFRDPQTLLSASRDGEIRQWSLGDALQPPPVEESTTTPQVGE